MATQQIGVDSIVFISILNAWLQEAVTSQGGGGDRGRGRQRQLIETGTRCSTGATDILPFTCPACNVKTSLSKLPVGL